MAHRTWYIDKLALTATRRGTFETANASGMNPSGVYIEFTEGLGGY